MRKFLSILLVLVMVLSMSACGKKENPAPQQTSGTETSQVEEVVEPVKEDTNNGIEAYLTSAEKSGLYENTNVAHAKYYLDKDEYENSFDFVELLLSAFGGLDEEGETSELTEEATEEATAEVTEEATEVSYSGRLMRMETNEASILMDLEKGAMYMVMYATQEDFKAENDGKAISELTDEELEEAIMGAANEGAEVEDSEEVTVKNIYKYDDKIIVEFEMTVVEELGSVDDMLAEEEEELLDEELSDDSESAESETVESVVAEVAEEVAETAEEVAEVPEDDEVSELTTVTLYGYYSIVWNDEYVVTGMFASPDDVEKMLVYARGVELFAENEGMEDPYASDMGCYVWLETEGDGIVAFANDGEEIDIDEEGAMSFSSYADEGSTITLYAKAEEGWKFDKWLNGEEVVSTEPEFTVTVDEDIDYIAVFVEDIVE